MKKNLDFKKNIINKFDILFKKNLSFLSFNINNISSDNINRLRKNFKNLNFDLFFIKKSLLIKYFTKDINLLNLIKNNIFNQFIIIFSKSDPIFLIKNLNNFININNFGNIDFVYFNKKIYINEEIKFLGSLLSYKDTILKFIYILKKISILRFLDILYILKNIKNNN